MKTKSLSIFKIIRIFAVIGVAWVLFGFVAIQVVSDPKKVMRINDKNGAYSINAKASSYYLDTGRFPVSIEDLLSNDRKLTNWKGPYVTEQQSKDPWGRRYILRTPGLHSEIDVVSLGADGLVSGVGANADFGNWK